MGGEWWMLNGSHSVFGPLPADAELAAGATGQDIHPTGPMWGVGQPRREGALRLLEEIAAAEYADICARLVKARLKQERHTLRMRAQELGWEWLSEGDLVLRFTLPAGAYATVLLRELSELRDVRRPG